MKNKCEQGAYTNLIEKEEKWKFLEYTNKLSMADYLFLNNQLTVKDQQEIFAIRTEINPPIHQKKCIKNSRPMVKVRAQSDYLLKCYVQKPFLKTSKF